MNQTRNPFTFMRLDIISQKWGWGAIRAALQLRLCVTGGFVLVRHWPLVCVAKNSCFFNNLRTLSHILRNPYSVDLLQVQQRTGLWACRGTWNPECSMQSERLGVLRLAGRRGTGREQEPPGRGNTIFEFRPEASGSSFEFRPEASGSSFEFPVSSFKSAHPATRLR
jgi:hypothetical protein